ncbi:MAG: fused MFS/spermidine synthase, partial [Acidobacteria bacterium]|nr:fused MFS/spermidine synthase [Acidobacteriota bacterium]
MGDKFEARGSGALGALIPAAYLLSGFCALIYETVWIHQFSLVFGSTVHALAVVVAVFLGGLALGSRLFARVSVRIARPVRLYGWLEIGIGAYALVVPALVNASDSLYARLPAVTGADGVASLPALTLARIGVATAVLLLPTVLMGGTLPILVRHMVTHLDQSARGPGLLYGVNAVGAALGSFTAGYLLLEHLGVARTNGLAAGLNIGIGIVALLISARTPPVTAAARKDRASGRTGATPRTLTLVIICFTLSGFVSMAYQVIWLRHLTFFLQDTIHLYSGIITIFVLGIGVGSLAGARLPWLERRPVAAFGWLQAGIGVTTLGALYAPVLVVQPMGGLWEMGGAPVLLVVAALLGLPTLMMGAIFPAVARTVTREVAWAGESVGRAYAWNTAGSIAGTLTAGFILFPWLGLQTTLVLLFGLNMVAAAALLRSDAGAWRRAAALPLALLVIFPLATALLPGIRLPRALLERLIGSGGNIVAVREGITGTTWVVHSGEDDVSLLENGVVIGRRGRGTWVIAGFVPLLIAEEVPRRVLALAFGAGLSTLPARLFDEVEQLDLVDISRDNVEAALAHIPENRDLPLDPRVRLLVDDAY